MNTKIRTFFCWVALAGAFGCASSPLKPGHSIISPQGIELKQSQNPSSVSSQDYERTTVFEPAIKLPDEEVVTTQPYKRTVTEKVRTTIGAAQKDTAREIGAKLSSLKGVVWVGVLVFLFGAASAFWPPLKAVVGSMTTSAIACAAGLSLIVLPSMIVGNEVLILGISVGAVGLYWFAHRHASVHTEVKVNKK